MAKPKKQKKDINFLSNLKYVSPSKVREHFASAKLGVGDSVVHSDGDDNVILECVIAYPDDDDWVFFTDCRGRKWSKSNLNELLRALYGEADSKKKKEYYIKSKYHF